MVPNLLPKYFSKQHGIDWIDVDSQRNHVFSGIAKTGNRKEISRMVNTLMRREREIEVAGKK